MSLSIFLQPPAWVQKACAIPNAIPAANLRCVLLRSNPATPDLSAPHLSVLLGILTPVIRKWNETYENEWEGFHSVEDFALCCEGKEKETNLYVYLEGTAIRNLKDALWDALIFHGNVFSPLPERMLLATIPQNVFFRFSQSESKALDKSSFRFASWGIQQASFLELF